MQQNKTTTTSKPNADNYIAPAYDIKPARIFTEFTEMKKHFPKINSGEMLGYEGCEFFWQKAPNEPMVLFAHRHHKDFSVLCTVAASEHFFGVGTFIIDYPVVKNAHAGILITCYRYSSRISDLSHLVHTDGLEFVPAGTMHIEGEDKEKFYALAEARFQDIR